MAWLLICSRSPSALSCLAPEGPGDVWLGRPRLLRRGGAERSSRPRAELLRQRCLTRPGRFCERLSHRHCSAFRAATRFQEPPRF